MITTVLFDLDNTLFDFDRSEADALRCMLETLGLPISQDIITAYNSINAGLWRRLERGEITREVLVYERFAKLFEQFGLSADPVRAQSVYITALSASYHYLPGAQELLEQLCPKYALYLVSNGTAQVQDGRIARSGIAKYFKDIFISQRIGADKPSPVFFERCFAEIPNFRKAETIIVGDSLTSDILGGKNAGIVTCRYNPDGKLNTSDVRPDHEIRVLSELPTLLDRLAKG